MTIPSGLFRSSILLLNNRGYRAQDMLHALRYGILREIRLLLFSVKAIKLDSIIQFKTL